MLLTSFHTFNSYWIVNFVIQFVLQLCDIDGCIQFLAVIANLYLWIKSPSKCEYNSNDNVGNTFLFITVTINV